MALELNEKFHVKFSSTFELPSQKNGSQRSLSVNLINRDIAHVYFLLILVDDEFLLTLFGIICHDRRFPLILLFDVFS